MDPWASREPNFRSQEMETERREIWRQHGRRFWDQKSRNHGTLGQQVRRGVRLAAIGVSDNRTKIRGWQIIV